MELSGPKTPPGPSLCLKIVVAAVCGKANDPLTPLKRLQRNYLVMGIVRENVPSSIPFFPPFLTQNLTQNRKNWGGAESTQPPGFGLFQVTKPPENVEPQQMDKPTAAHNPEVGGSSPPPATNKPLKSHGFSGFLHFLSLFGWFYFSSLVLTQIVTHTGNFSGKGWITLERLGDCRRVHSPWFGPLVAERRWSHERRYPG